MDYEYAYSRVLLARVCIVFLVWDMVVRHQGTSRESRRVKPNTIPPRRHIYEPRERLPKSKGPRCIRLSRSPRLPQPAQFEDPGRESPG